MPLLPRLSSLWRNLFHKSRKEQEMTEEIDAYLELLVEQKIKEGLDPAEARRAALIELGGREQVKEKVRDARAGRQLETFWQDLRYAMRMLRRDAGFAAAAVLAVGVGVRANTAIFSVVNAVIMRPLPYYEPDRLAILWTDDPRHDFHEAGTSYLNFADWRAQSQTFADLAICSRGNPVTLVGADEQEQVMAEQVSASLFQLMGVNAMLGRGISHDEEERGESVVVLSYGIWQRRFGGDSDIVGKTLELSGAKFHSSPLFKIIGVMPANFYFPNKDTQLWLATVPRGRQQRFNDLWRVVGRLKPNATFPQAQAEMTAIGQRLAQPYPTTD